MDEDHLRDLFTSLPAVSIRRFFGGQGVYSEGRIVAVVIDGELHTKCDAETEGVYEAAGCRRWRYARPGRALVAMPYYRVPDEALEQAEEMERWAELAARAARNAAMTAKPARGAGRA